MKYTGKYKDLAEQFQADGCNKATIERFIREEMERDAFEEQRGTTDLQAYEKWKSRPEAQRWMYLSNAFCLKCGVTCFAPGYTVRKDRFGLIVEGTCQICGAKITRCCY